MKTSEIVPGDILLLHNGNLARAIESDEPLPIGMILCKITGPTRMKVDLPVYLYSVVKVRYSDGSWGEVEHSVYEINQKRQGLKGVFNVNMYQLRREEAQIQLRLNEIEEEMWETDDRADLAELKCEKTLLELKLSDVRLGLYVEPMR